MSLEPGLGGRFVEQWGDTGGQIIATVTGLEPDRYLRLPGPFHFGLALGDAMFDLEDAPLGTLVRFVSGGRRDRFRRHRGHRERMEHAGGIPSEGVGGNRFG